MRFKYKLEVIPTFADRVCETLVFMVEANTRDEADRVAAEKKSTMQGVHILTYMTQEDVFLYEIETKDKNKNKNNDKYDKSKKVVTYEIAAFSKERADDIAASKLDRKDTSVYDFLTFKGKKE